MNNPWNWVHLFNVSFGAFMIGMAFGLTRYRLWHWSSKLCLFWGIGTFLLGGITLASRMGLLQ